MPLMVEDTSTDDGITTNSVISTEVPHNIRIKNRRKRYLDLHPEYFGPQLELADPLLYDRLIRRFQTPAERESEGRKKGYSGVLEADLWRGEAKIEALKNHDPDSLISYRRGANGEILAEEKDEIPPTKEEGYIRWKEAMEQKFLSGKDTDFEYEQVDASEEFDDKAAEEREAEEVYFDSETPQFVEGDEGVNTLGGETGIQDF